MIVKAHKIHQKDAWAAQHKNYQTLVPRTDSLVCWAAGVWS